MNKKDHILVKVSVNGIREGLVKIISSEHAQLIANVIIEQLSYTEIGLNKLHVALSGIPYTYKCNPLDEVWVSLDYLPNWRMDKPAMEKAGILKKNYVKCTVTEIHPHKKECYNLRFNLIKPGESEISTDEYTVQEDGILDQYPEMEGDTLPF